MIARSPLRHRTVTRLLVPVGICAVTACSDGTGPDSGSGSWEYTAPASITAPRTVTLTPGLVSVSSFGGTVHAVLDPATGRERFRIDWSAGGPLYRAGSTLILASGNGSPAGTSRVHDAEDGRLLFALTDSSRVRQGLGTIGTVLISVVNDTLLEAHDRGTGSFRWRRPVPAVACTRFCGQLLPVDVIGETLTLYRVTDVAASLFRVTPDGTTTPIATDREVFRSGSAVRFAARASVGAPIVVASTRSIAALDPASGATRWRTVFDALVPTGYSSQASRRHFSADGSWLTVRMLDSAGTSAVPARDIFVRTFDGRPMRERTYTGEQSNDLFAGACDAADMVRVLPDLRLEFTDLVTGAITESSVNPALAALLTTPTVNGFISGTGASVGTTLIVSDPISGKLSGIRCRV